MRISSTVLRGPGGEIPLGYSPTGLVFSCKNGRKLMNVSTSTTSEDENLTNRYHNDQWNNINWSEVETLVNRLQARIIKAVIKENWNLVKRLQYLLVHSSYAKMLAVTEVQTRSSKASREV